MSISDAIKELMNHKEFIRCAKTRNKRGAQLRMFRVRFNRGLIDTAAMIEILESFKYNIQINIVKKPAFFYHEDCEKS